MRRYPQFRSTPGDVQALPSVGSPPAQAQTVRRKRPGIGDITSPVQSLRAVPAAGATTHGTSGTLTAGSSTVSGAATHLTLHTTAGALAADAATVSGSATHSVPSGTHPTDGALTASEATVAGTATHLTLHATSGALSAQAATLSGASTHTAPTTHTATGSLVAQAAAVRGVAAGPIIFSRNDPGGGNGRPAKKPARVADEPLDRRSEEREVVEFITALVAAGVL